MAEFLRRLQVVPDLGIKQQRLGGDAAHVQASAAEFVVFLDEGDFQSELPGAYGRGITGRAAADDGHVINLVCHV